MLVRIHLTRTSYVRTYPVCVGALLPTGTNIGTPKKLGHVSYNRELGIRITEVCKHREKHVFSVGRGFRLLCPPLRSR